MNLHLEKKHACFAVELLFYLFVVLVDMAVDLNKWIGFQFSVIGVIVKMCY